MSVTWTWRYLCPWGFTSTISATSAPMTIVDGAGGTWTYSVPSGTSAPTSGFVVGAASSPSGRDTYLAFPNKITNVLTPAPSNFVYGIALNATGSTGYQFTYSDGTVNDGLGSGHSNNNSSGTSLPGGFWQFDMDERGLYSPQVAGIGNAPAAGTFSNNAGFGGYWLNKTTPFELLGFFGGDVISKPPDFWLSGTAPASGTATAVPFAPGRFLSNITMAPASTSITLTCWDSSGAPTTTIVPNPLTQTTNVYLNFDTSAVTTTTYTQKIIYRYNPLFGSTGYLIAVNDPNSGTANYTTIYNFSIGATDPDPPQNLTVTSPDNGLLHITWAPALKTANPALTGYVITVLNGSAVITTKNYDTNTFSADITSMPLATLVTVQIIAQNSFGNSTIASTTVTTANITAAPAAAPVFTITQTATLVTVTFPKIALASSYVVTFTPADKTLLPITLTGTSSPLTDGAVVFKAGVSYSVTMIANNSIGSSPTSAVTAFSLGVSSSSSSLTSTLIIGAVILAAAFAIYYYFRFIRHASPVATTSSTTTTVKPAPSTTTESSSTAVKN